MKLTAHEVQIINQYLQDKPVVRAYVFRSYARDEADLQSDLDLLLEPDYGQPIGLQLVGMKFDLEEKLNKAVDLLSFNGLSSRIRPFIDRDKQLIYERTIRR